MERKNNKNHLAEQAMRFLSDRPLEADKEREMRFGHRSIVENLKNMVSKCPTPFTIGLFGKWGTGKTTILDSLKHKFRASEIAVVIIDAWKHEGDALRRTFLQDTINQLQEKQDGKQYLSKEVKLSENLRVPISRTFHSGIKASYSLLWPFLIFLATLIVVGIFINIYSPNNLGTYISTVFGGGLVIGILIWLLQQSVTTETVTTVTDRFQDPQQFEDEFKGIIEKVSAEKLLIIIDNLDRVSCEKAIEILSTMKTFLEQDRCVFLIACDAQAIKSHLESLYDLSSDRSVERTAFDGDEYLRKFFNSNLIIPEFIDTELYSYTEKLIDESNLHAPDRPDVAYIITKAFRDNPRQIKQFINTLISHLSLAERRELSQELPEGTITKNVAYLAKDLILRLRFPEYYDSWTRGEKVDSNNTEFDDFLRATKPIDAKDSRPFRYLKLSEQEIELPEIENLKLSFQDNDVDQASQLIGGFKTDTGKLLAFRRFIPSFVDNNKGRGLLLFNIVSSILTSTKKLGVEFDKHLYHQVAELLNDDSQLGTQLQNFDPNIIFSEVLSQCDKSLRADIIHRYSGLFSEPNNIKRDDRDIYVKSLLQEFMEHTAWLNNTRKQEIRDAIAQKYCNYEILYMFIDKPDEQKEFLDEEILSKFIGEISGADIEEPEKFGNKIGLLIEFESIITDKNLSEIITQFTAILPKENTKPYRSEKEDFVSIFKKVIIAYDQRLAGLSSEIINPLAEHVLAAINALGPMVQKRIFIPACIWLVNILADPTKSQINAVINTFFASGNAADLAFVFNGISKKGVEELLKTYNDTLKRRVLSDQNIFDYLYPLATKDTKTEWLSELIQVDHQRAINKLEQLNYRVDDKKTVVSAIFTKMNNLPQIMQRRDLYSVCNRMKCANDAELKGKFVENIKTLLKDATPDPQKMGLELLQEATYLSQTQRRDIAIDTIDWLSGLQPEGAYQQSSAKSVLLAWSLLTAPPREKFLYYVFDILIRRGSTIQNIQLGLNILGQIDPKPQYEDNSRYFDDLLNRAETETDPNIKSLLVNGLKSMDPKQLNDRNRDFWRRVRKSSFGE